MYTEESTSAGPIKMTMLFFYVAGRYNFEK
jgi:hypothetical protein